jgi:16S rRNA (uracil1498-N3)-methyltransferase
LSDLSRNTPPQFFVEPGAVSASRVYLSGDSLKHATSQRLRPGELFRVVVETGEPAEVIEAEVIEVTRRRLAGRICNTYPAEKPPYALHLYPAILKGDKFDLVVRGATELGVTSITPVIAARTIPRLDENKLAIRRARWQKLARAAAEQSSRPFIPEIRQPMRCTDLLAGVTAGLPTGVPGENPRTVSGTRPHVAGVPVLAVEKREITKSVAEAVGPAREVSMFIGPEGGFDSGEVELAFEKGLQPVTLGPYILKAETASLAACAIVIDHILHGPAVKM